MTKKEAHENKTCREKLLNIIDGRDEEMDPHTTAVGTHPYIRMSEFTSMQLKFYAFYSQMYPQHFLSHIEYQITLYSLISEGWPVHKVIEYDDLVHKHYINKIGEPWIMTDLNFIAKLQTFTAGVRLHKQDNAKQPNSKQRQQPNFKSKQQQCTNNFRQSNKSKAPQDKVCYAYNGMFKGVTMCEKPECQFPHVCKFCKGPHPKSACDKKKIH